MLLISACPAQAEAADDPLTLRRLSGREIAALDALGHVCLYLLQDGQCTVIDDSWYIFGNYRIGRDFPVLQTAGLGSPAQAATACPQHSQPA